MNNAILVLNWVLLYVFHTLSKGCVRNAQENLLGSLRVLKYIIIYFAFILHFPSLPSFEKLRLNTLTI